VHEAYLKLGSAQLAAQDRNHLLALSARAMRQVLVDDARARKADKRGGDQCALTLGAVADAGNAAALEVLKLDELLESLHRLDERAAQVVELRISAATPKWKSPACWTSARAPCAATGGARAHS
jgi:ECF sigma factor.